MIFWLGLIFAITMVIYTSFFCQDGFSAQCGELIKELEKETTNVDR